MSFLALTGNALASVVKGLQITLRNLVQWRRRVQTVMYPEQPVELSERARGMPIVDLEECIGCYACEKICPNNLIKIETKPSAVKGKRDVTRFDLDYALCMLCNLCEDVCPTDPRPERRAIRLSPGISVVHQDRKSLRQGMDGRYIGPVPPEEREALALREAQAEESRDDAAEEPAPKVPPKRVPAAPKAPTGDGEAAPKTTAGDAEAAPKTPARPPTAKEGEGAPEARRPERKAEADGQAAEAAAPEAPAAAAAQRPTEGAPASGSGEAAAEEIAAPAAASSESGSKGGEG